MKKIVKTILQKAFYLFISNSFTKKKMISLKEPVVSFTFDDVPKETFSNGVPILKKYGYKGTFYVSGNLTKNDFFMQKKHIKQLQREGHEIGGHTFGHIKTTCSKGMLVKDLAKSKKFFSELGIKLRSFAYPNGAVGIWNKSFLCKKFLSCRTTIDGMNNGLTDLSVLRAYRLYDSTISIKSFSRLLERAKSEKGWLIFYTHDVSKKPSQYGCSTRLFEKLVKKVNESGINVMPVQKVVENINN